MKRGYQSSGLTFMFIILGFMFIIVPLPSHADTKTFNSSADTYVSAEMPATSFGSEALVGVGTGDWQTGIKAYIRFDLAQIPVGSTVSSAKLRLYCTGLFDNGYVVVARASENWTESLTWQNLPGSETPAIPSTPSGQSTWWEIDVSSIVRKWIENGDTNRGFSLEGEKGLVMFRSREASSNRPQLVITYTPGRYAASGFVKNLDDQGVQQVQMVFSRVSGSGNLPGSVYSGATGQWSQSGFEPGTTYRVTPQAPSETAYIFNPLYRNFSSQAGQNLDNLNFSTDTKYSVTITSSPSGAAVHLGSPTAVSLGNTPFTLNNLEGNDVVYLTIDGYNDCEITISPANAGETLSCTLEEIPFDDAKIVAFSPPSSTGTYQRSQQVQTTVTVKNTGNTTRKFWVGLSFAHENATWQGWPNYWYDIKPKETSVLNPGQQETLIFPFELHLNLWPGKYYAVAKIWPGFDPELYRMVPPEIDSTLNYLEWQGLNNPNGTGMESFSLGAYIFPADSLLGQIQTAILRQFYQVPSLENLYINGAFSKKLLLSIPVGAKSITLGQKVVIDVGGSVLIDLFDLFGVTPESQGDDGTVTVWTDASASIGLGIGLPIVIHEFNYSERATVDYRKYLSGSVFKLTTPAFVATALECTGDGCRPRFQWVGNAAIGLDVAGINVNQLLGGEISRRLLLSTFNSVPGDVMGITGLLDYILNALSGEAAPPLQAITYDDGSWPIYDGRWESPLKLDPPNTTDFFAHFFAIDVPSGTSRLRFVSDNVGQNSIGNCNLYVQYGERPSLSNYRLRSLNSDNLENLSIDNPESGEWFAMLPAGAAYDQVQFAAILESAGLPVVTITVMDSDASEPGFNTSLVRLSRTGSTSGSLTVSIALLGTAALGVDYSDLPNSVTFSSGQATVDLAIVPIDDTLVEGDETVIIMLMEGSSYEVGSQNSATVIIADNDSADIQRPTASPNVAGISSGGAGVHTFTVTYSDNVAINVDSIDDNDIIVTGPNAYNQIASFEGISDDTKGTPRTATYFISAPEGRWDYRDNGTYSISMRVNQVTDTSGNSVLNGLLASFTVNISSLGDIHPDGVVDMTDIVCALKILAKMECTGASSDADLNGDGKIGLVEVVYILQEVSGVRAIDNDGDGYTENQGDCDDNNPSVNPGSSEVCGDAIDNDCDSSIDEGCED